ncbi:transient receptor potential cation channel subfamily A member 1 homolog [Haliotis rubra]|uniref:transient receptor potential cation channel subfamily A member 1 homolog n=1 Tax=Haliotis rubra TaxID=36100 RepID=UPI001EE5D507|nr:transient receptor potential cation channel subfamily A member 1 homolog [Haliotis rubra]
MQRPESFKTTSTGRSLLHAAAAHGDLEMVEFLCEKGGDVRETDRGEQTVVHAAAGSSLEAAEKLYYLIEEKRAPFLDVDKKGRTALFPAAEVGDREVVEYLVEKGIDPTKHDNDGKSVLDVAASSVRDVISRNMRRLSSAE